MTERIAPVATFVVVLTLGAITTNNGSAEHAAGVRVRDYVPRSRDEAAIVRLVRTVGEGWERKDVEQILAAYAPDAVQRAWNDPTRIIDVAGVRAEALDAFADPKLGRVEFAMAVVLQGARDHDGQKRQDAGRERGQRAGREAQHHGAHAVPSPAAC